MYLLFHFKYFELQIQKFLKHLTLSLTVQLDENAVVRFVFEFVCVMYVGVVNVVSFAVVGALFIMFGARLVENIILSLFAVCYNVYTVAMLTSGLDFIVVSDTDVGVGVFFCVV